MAEKRFVTKVEHEKNLAAHAAVVPEAVASLRAQGVKGSESRKLEFFFATNSSKKAHALAETLEAHGHDATVIGEKKRFVISGISPKVKMTEAALTEWSQQMATMGFEVDATFDGWQLHAS